VKEVDSTLSNSGDHWCYQNAIEQNDYVAPEVEQNESNYRVIGSSPSHMLISHKSLPLQNGDRVYSKKSQNITPENKLAILDKSECINYKSAVSWNSVPLSDNESNKDTNEKIQHNFMHLNKMGNLFSHMESNRDISRSENISYLSNKEDTFYSEIRSDTVHMKTKLSDGDSSKCTMSKEHVSRHNSRRGEYEYISYSKYKPERQSVRATVTHSRHASSEHRPYPERNRAKR
jgi:hypothetical protein